MFTSLVLGAAMTNACMYIGAYRYLYERGMHKTIRNIYGTSSGAIFGFMIVMGMAPDDISRLCKEVVERVEVPRLTARRIWNMWRLKGFLPDDLRRSFAITALKQRFPDLEDIDFSTLAKLTGINFVVCGLNLSKGCEEYFSVDTHPAMSVLHAIDISTTLPFACNHAEYMGDVYIDGGVTNVVPSDVVKDSEHTTLVLYIAMRNGVQKLTNMLDMFGLMFRAVMRMRMQANTTRYKHTVALDVPAEHHMSVVQMLSREAIQNSVSAETLQELDRLSYDMMERHMQVHAPPMQEPARVLPQLPPHSNASHSSGS